MYVGQCYSELCTSEEQRRQIWMLIASERDRSRQAILDIVGGAELLATTPWFQGSIEVRNPDIDPLPASFPQLSFSQFASSDDPSKKRTEAKKDGAQTNRCPEHVPTRYLLTL